MTNTDKIIGAVQTVWEALQGAHPDLPDVIVAIDTTGARHNLGYPEGKVIGAPVPPELPVHIDTIRAGAMPVMEHVVHVATHALCNVRGVSETSNRGTRHNKKFAAMARELGGQWPDGEPPHPVKGFSPVPVTGEAMPGMAAYVEALGRVLAKVDGLEELADTAPRGKSGTRMSLECGCGRTLQMGRRVAGLGAVICGICKEEFTER
ncbi:hypothetical protein AB0O20_11890 [Streptomyces kronopolitis]|uniref:hypothetical protein n=1 Tax=Streptomyces kronopolitis TaxID=1612435 RepID=UPI0034277761